MDKKTFTIGVLVLSAVILMAANLLQPNFAQGKLVEKDNEYTAVTARVAKGGEALYVVDNRSGMLVALVYDPSKKAIVPMGKPRLLTDAFPAAGGRK